MSPDLSVTELAKVLFCSDLQPSQAAEPQAVSTALRRGLRAHGGQLEICAAELASCYGDDPETASRRMRWALSLIIATYQGPPLAA
ncbi:hypothetical protein [Sporichthya sp.]|uniref:hypothetical protein n=1 Tax=Sporichthya sp. TaxID=65475 RepID=UPI0017B371C2|nr:hypothetical protein [Sporichthya sp.]MBA3743278.1 hypothetical protein [Sporichthya sp.]